MANVTDQNAIIMSGNFVSVVASVKRSKSPTGYQDYHYICDKAIADTLSKDDQVVVKNITKDFNFMNGKVVEVKSYLDVDKFQSDDAVRIVVQKVDVEHVDYVKAVIEDNKTLIASAKAKKMQDEINQYLGDGVPATDSSN